MWVLATLIAAAAQTARNAVQSHLTREIGTLAATQVRFLFGLPFALMFLAALCLVTGDAPSTLTPQGVAFTALGALSQIAATALMLATMKTGSFAVTTAWIKTEPVLVALTAAAVLGDPLTPSAFSAIGVATAGVILVSTRPGTALWGDARPVLTGLAAGALFGLAAIGFRGGITALPEGGFLMRATTVLALSMAMQAGVLGVGLALFHRAALRASLGVWRASLGAGFLGAFASQFWFIGFALTNAANVRTVALVEVLMAQGVAYFIFRQPVTLRQAVGMAVIVAGVAALLLSQQV